jgi:hypothetical protein
MHRNTYLLVIVLSICAALLVGVNIGKSLQKQSVSIPTSTPNLTATPTQSIIIQTYMDTYCGFSLSYPSNFTVLENASGSAILNNPADKTQSITLTCQKGIPRPALPADKIESFLIPTSSISATLYHDTSSKDGNPIDAVIFTHPKNKMDIFIAGYGDAFNAAIQTLQILP